MNNFEMNNFEMNKNVNVNMITHQILPMVLILAGGVLLLWFCWPVVCKGILNIGSICGISGSLGLLIYGCYGRRIHQLIMHLRQKKPIRFCMDITALFIICGIILAVLAAVSILRAESENIPDHTPAIVLGCSVKGSRPSRILQERIDAAYAYMQEHPQAVCVLSGGQGKDEDISEAECMYEALREAGIEPRRMYKEDKSTNTRENLEYSKTILDDLGVTGAVTIITNEFHLYRGRTWAGSLGYQHYGYGAATDWRYFPTYFIREILAVVHLWLEQTFQMAN